MDKTVEAGTTSHPITGSRNTSEILDQNKTPSYIIIFSR